MAQSKRFHESIEMYTKALEILPSNNSIVLISLHGRANAKSNIGNFHEAIDDCTQALAIDASCVKVRLLRAQCYHYLEEFQASINDYELVECADELQNDMDKASEVKIKLANIKIEMNRKLADAKNANGNEQLQLNNYDLAEKHFSDAIALWPNNLIFYGNHCNCLIKQGQLQRALQDCQQIIKIDPNYRMGYEFQAKCYLIYGDYDSAEQAADNLERIQSQSSKHFNDLSTKLRNDYELATKNFDDGNYSKAGIVLAIFPIFPRFKTTGLFSSFFSHSC